MVPIERQASEGRPTVESAFSTSPIVSTAHQTSESPAQAGADGSVRPLDESRDRASDGLGNDEASLVEANKAMPSSKLRENGSIRPTEPRNASEDINSPATRKQTHKYVQSLKKKKQDQLCLALSTPQTLRNDADNNPENKYRYSPLPGPGSIRLLRLMAHTDENAPIECLLFDYPLQELGEGTHLYEALSYVWGDSNNLRSSSIDKHDLLITINLYTALSYLRDRFIDRIIWVDAICINQGDMEEKGMQVQYMSEIYSKASRVIVWLGEAENDSDLALEEIRLAADEMSEPLVNEPTKQAILTLLQRSWFKRIWVREQTFNSELIEMYHTREASMRHDKVFALLGMSSDDPIAADLLPDYKTPWKILLERLVRFLLGGQVSVKTWADTEMAVIKSKGCILGQVSSKGEDRQQMVITSKNVSGHMGPGREWTLLTSAKSIQVGDLVCFLQGSLKPTVIRPCKDHFSVIMITVTPPGTENGSVGQPEQPIASFSRDFLLVWDWERFQGNLQDQEYEYETLIRSRVAKHPDREVGGHSDKMTRLWNVALILEDAVEYEKAEERFRETVEGYERGFGKEDLRTLTGMEKLALIYKKMKQWKKAEKRFKQVIQTRKRVQGEDHPDRTSSMANLASMYRDQGHLEEAEKWEAMADILRREGGDAQIMEEEVVKIARSCDKEVMKLLLDRKGDEVQITEGVVTAAAGNKSRGGEMMKLLLDRKGDEVQITESVITAAAGNKSSGGEIMKLLLDRKGTEVQITEEAVIQIVILFDQGIMKLLLDRKGDEVQITEGVVTAAAGNKSRGGQIMKLLLDRKGDEVQITEGVITVAAGNESRGGEIIKLLLDWKGDEVQITEGVIIAAAGNVWRGGEIMQLLLDRKGDEVQITEGVITAAAGNISMGGEIIKLLLDRKGDEVQITEGVITAAAENKSRGGEIMKLLLDRKGDEVQITEGVIIAAAGNISMGGEIIKLLLDRKGDEVQITEGVVTVVAGYGFWGGEIMKLLLDRKGDEVQITEGVITVAAGNEWSGEEIMKLLLDRKGDEVQITEGVVTAAAGNKSRGGEIIKLLLDRKGDEVQITEGVIIAAAGNVWRGGEIMKLLLDRKGDEVQITKGVVTAAAGNKSSGEKVMKLLLDQKGNEVQITVSGDE
ncbi:hypothetical protein OEA41_001150 [Lepraria neglecta]|uniref:Heterokaryon incompatibility domain-containing protein n=1 Tax=Lepraria neglecta TaxID=209136 RepID=A0AAD9ZH39_9LECA|nr:hypothetical protein OEA41_001150 [Lepraria neglecta]